MRSISLLSPAHPPSLPPSLPPSPSLLSSSHILSVAGGVQSYYTNSHIVHAEASRPEGPFVYKDTALGPFSGNPHVIATADGGLVLFHIGNGMPHDPEHPLVNCSGKDGHSTRPMPSEHWPTQTNVGPAFGGIHTSPGPEGPWSSVGGLPSGACENPAPMQHSNGTWFVVCNEGNKVLYSAKSPAGPWLRVGVIQDASNTPTVAGTPTQWTNSSVWEDPWMWMDAAGHWHVLCHAYPPILKAQCGVCALHYGDVVAGHGFSTDGTPGSWTWSSTPPFTRYVNFTGGNPLLSYGARERPYLLLEDGAPVALYTSVTYPGSPQKEGPNDASFVLMQAVRRKGSAQHSGGLGASSNNDDDAKPACGSSDDPRDCAALIDLAESTSYKHWTARDGWLKSGVSVCVWFGVTCKKDRVVKLQLQSNNLSGSVPASIEGLTQLSVLDLRGTRPPGYGPESCLAQGGNNFNNSQLPHSFYALENLVTLNMEYTCLGGTLSPALGNMLKLQDMLIHGNFISGTLPIEIDNLPQLVQHKLGRNPISGTLPPLTRPKPFLEK